MLQANAVFLAVTTLAAKPTSPQRMTRTTSGADHRLQAMLLPDLLQILHARLPAPQQYARFNNRKMIEAVVTASDQSA